MATKREEDKGGETRRVSQIEKEVHETEELRNCHISPNGRGLGWRKQRPDHRDAAFLYSVPHGLALALPPKAEVSQLPIWDQGQLGSCTGNGIGYCLLHDGVKQKILKPNDIPSRLQIYWGERWIEGSIQEDAGAEIRDGIKFIAKYGACLESGPNGWPYDPSKFTQRPPNNCWKEALKYQGLRYRVVPQTTIAIRSCIAEGFPVVYGFTCYPGLDSNEASKTGYIPMPGSNEAPIGGHCVAIVGYDDNTRRFKIRNSWGTGWGDKGYGYFDYEYVIRTDLSSDFWTVRVIG
jgi:hypothetical protein